MHMINCIERGITGFDFAVSIVAFYDLSAYGAIAKHGKEGILKRLQAVPDLWVSCQLVEQELDEFITDFLTYGEKNAAA